MLEVLNYIFGTRWGGIGIYPGRRLIDGDIRRHHRRWGTDITGGVGETEIEADHLILTAGDTRLLVCVCVKIYIVLMLV